MRIFIYIKVNNFCSRVLYSLIHYLCAMKKKILIFGTFFVVLIAAFWLMLAQSKGYFDVKLPVMNYVQNFSFVDQNGQKVTQTSLDGKVYVTEYFFTTCTGICPKMNANMVKVYDKFKNDKGFAILSHTSLPEVDSVPVLKAYQEKLIGKENQNGAHWYFVTGLKDSLYKMARQSYLLDDPNNNSLNLDDNFIHTQFFALVDQEKRLRGIYDGLKKDDLARMEKDIKSLLKNPNS